MKRFSVTWKRSEEQEKLTCNNLSIIQLVARCINLLRNCKSVEILKLEIEK